MIDCRFVLFAFFALTVVPLVSGVETNPSVLSLRQTITLDGQWQIAEGKLTEPPKKFDREVPVPGLVDMAKPVFNQASRGLPAREAFWYRRTFQFAGPITDMARLKIHKAMFGCQVILNGIDLGEHQSAFTPGYFDVRRALKIGENEIIIRVSVFEKMTPKRIGTDYEKTKFIPGIFDSVELILSGTPYIERIQAVPDIDKNTVAIYVWPEQSVQVTIREAVSKRVVGEASGKGPLNIPIKDCRHWSPETPFLYETTVKTTGDELTARFGMRTFRLDPQTGRAMLNGKPYFMRGSNITLYRFFEDSERADLPWNEGWIRTLHQRCKDMHWNSLRYSIGFPPEVWYRIADEVGILIQDEFPIWNMGGTNYDEDNLVLQYSEWMQERWNHPCVVIWDACNETRSAEIGRVISRVRDLDLSRRPWDNAWSKPAMATDSREEHPYHFKVANFKLSKIKKDPGTLNRKTGESPIIINEYGWLWLNRDGTPTTLTLDLYDYLLGPKSTTEQRRHLYARYMAAETEFWRSRRACAAVMHFCCLGYSRPNGQTSDHWENVEKLTWEPEFYRYVRDAFAPVGVMIDAWEEDYQPGQQQIFPVVIINDLEKPWQGELQIRILNNGKARAEQTRSAEVAGYGSTRLDFTFRIPEVPGNYQVEALIPGPVRSLRDFSVLTPEQREEKRNFAIGSSVKASSAVSTNNQTFSAELAVDGNEDTRWQSQLNDSPWMTLDFGKTQMISRVELMWTDWFAVNSFVIDVSSDGETWTTVCTRTNSRKQCELLRFGPVSARYLRLKGIQNSKPFGFKLSEIGVYKE